MFFSLFLQILEYARNRKCLYDGKVRGAALCYERRDKNEERKDTTQKSNVQGKVCVSRH